MFITKGVLKSNVPANGGTLTTITGSAGAAKIPLQILDFTQDVTGNISIPNNTYGYFQINMGAHDITGSSAACFTNASSFDIAVNGDSGAVINSAKHKTFSANGSGSSSNVASQGLSVSVANGSSGYSSFSTTITQGNSGYSGNQSSGNWNVIRENAGSGTGTWTARVLTNSTNLSGSCDGKALTVTKNGTNVVNLGNSGGSWGPIACSPGDVLVWTCSGGIGGGGTINRSQSWAWSGSPNIQYTANTNGGTSGSVVAKTISVTNSNSKSLQVTLSSSTTGISSNTNVNSGASRTLQSNNTSTNTSWTVAGEIADQTVSNVLYADAAAFDGAGVTTNSSGVPTDGISLTGFSGKHNRLIGTQ